MTNDNAPQRILVATTFNGQKQGVDMEFYPVRDDSDLACALEHCTEWVHEEFHNDTRAVSALLNEATLDEKLRITNFGKVIAILHRPPPAFR